MPKYNFLLFIDDDEATNYYHKYIVETSQLCDKYLFFDEAAKALDYFKKLSLEEKAELPDIIFLDINMPRIDGWGFLDRYTKMNISQSPVIIMLTTSINPRDKKKAEQYKIVEDFINKPLSERHLKQLMSRVKIV